MKIFIIGGAGYIGSHMVKIAYQAGHDVITIDNLSTGHKDSVLHGKFEFCDINHSDELNRIFKRHKPDAVMHFSACSLVGESISKPHKYYYNNVSGTLSLLKSMVDNNCKKLIFSSSAAVYGNPEYTPIDESHPKRPINPYGKSKLMIEEILNDFELAHGLKYISFRYFNAAGHDPDGELSERHDPETHLLPIIMQAINGKRDSVTIFGNDFDTKDGTCIRDYIHVNDLADAHLKGLDYILENRSSSCVLNLGNGEGFSVKEVIQNVKDLTGSQFVVNYGERRVGDPSILVADGKRAREKLKFSPKYDSLKSIIETLDY
tara:strand:+ start:28 stop:984 length:957 start_codon:yes stop_codon:yes gene_type:complete